MAVSTFENGSIRKAVGRFLSAQSSALAFGFTGLLLLMAVMAIDATRSLRSVEVTTAALRTESRERDALLDQLRGAIYRSATVVRDYLLEVDGARAESQKAELELLHTRIDNTLRVYKGQLVALGVGSAKPEQPGRDTAEVDRRFLIERHVGWSQYNAREQVFILRRKLTEHLDHFLAVFSISCCCTASRIRIVLGGKPGSPAACSGWKCVVVRKSFALLGASLAATRAAVAPFFGPNPVSTTSVAWLPTTMAMLGETHDRPDVVVNPRCVLFDHRLAHLCEYTRGSQRDKYQKGQKRSHIALFVHVKQVFDVIPEIAHPLNPFSARIKRSPYRSERKEIPVALNCSQLLVDQESNLLQKCLNHSSNAFRPGLLGPVTLLSAARVT